MAHEDLAGYSLRRGLGSGSAGTVWLLRDLATGRHAVLKRIPKSSVAVKSDFLADLELVRTIDHPHVARLLEVRESDREWLLFSQYVAAGTLTALLERRGTLSPGELVTLISPLAQGLSALHRSGLAHGHLGIDGVMFDADGRPVITDAGLRTLAPTSTPEADLAALDAIAHEAGGSPETFPPSLFTTNADLLSQQALHRAHPLPIDLGFAKDRHPPSSATTPPTASHPKPSHPKPSHPEPSQTSPATSRSTSPTSQPALDTSQPESGTSPASRRAPDAPPTSRRTPDTSHSTPVASGSPSAARTGRPPRPTHRRSAGREPARQSAMQAVRRLLRTKRAAYGILAACGAGAVATLVIGLATLGVLGHPATGSTAAAGPSTRPTPQPKPTTAQPKPTTARPMPARAADSMKWLQTLQALDVRRSRAFSTLDPADLDGVYVPGSAPWSADRALLASYRDQHLRIEGLRLGIETVTVKTPGTTTVVLRVVDRLVSGVAITASGQRTAFPPGRPTERLVTLSADATSWRISAIAKA